MGEMVERQATIYKNKIKCAAGIDYCSCGNPKNINQKRCSICYHKARFVIRQCPICEMPFWANHGELKNNRHVYCSRDCQAIGVNLIRYAKLIKHSLNEVINATIAGLKWCGYHKQFEHYLEFYRSKRGMFGLCPICKKAQFEKYRRKHPEPKRKRKVNSTAEKSEFVDIVRKTGRIKRAAKVYDISWQYLSEQRKDDPDFDRQILEAKNQFYRERYGTDYKRDQKGLNEVNYQFYVQNIKQVETWIKSAIYAKTKVDMVDFDMSEIIQLAVIMWCYSRHHHVQNKERLIKHYGRCAFFQYLRLRNEIITP